MKHFKVTFEVHRGSNHKEYKTVTVEAGNKKLATLRGMMAINKLDGYSDLFKNVIKVEEVA